MSREPIIGSGFRGPGFERKGFQERNINNLMNIFGSAEANQTLTELAKVKKDHWKAMGETIETIGDFMESGVTGGFSDIKQDLTASLSLTIQEALSPLKNEVEQALAEALEPIMPEIVAFTSEMSDFFRIAIGSWKALITGQWDNVLADISKKMPDWFKTIKNDFRDRMDELIANIRNGNIEGVSNLPGLPTGVGTGLGIAEAIIAGWVGFWSDLGWK